MINYIIFSLLITLCFEGMIYALFSNFSFKTYLALFIANIVLNLTMNIILTSIEDYSLYISVLTLFEVMTFITETFIFSLFFTAPIWYSIIVALTANMLSLMVGDLCNHYLKINETGTFVISSGILIITTALVLAFVFWKSFSPRLSGK